MLFSIGHSTRSLEAFLALLRAQHVGLVADVRSFPGSRHVPHFNQTPLRCALLDAGIAYRHLPLLGGRRPTGLDPSPNGAWHNASFRNFADYMQSALFLLGLDDVLTQASVWPVVLMCAESVPWRCHRSLIADAATTHGVVVQHIIRQGAPWPHVLHPCAHITPTGFVQYPAPICD